MIKNGFDDNNNDVIVEFVRRNYNLNVESVDKIKNVYRIEADNKIYCLKVIKYEYGHFLFIYNAIKHLQNNGFKKIPEFIKNIQGKEYTRFFDKYVYLTEWVNARKCNYDNPIEVSMAAIKLAELHEKSKGFKVSSDMQPRIGWLTWLSVFKTRKNEILDFKRRINKKDKRTQFDNLYMDVMDDELKRCDDAIDHLKESEYENKMKSEIKERGFCHHDYANHNILIEKNEEMNIIDFDYCMLDTHLHDLSSLIIRRMKNGKWSMENAISILQDYDTVKKVFKTDIPIMAAFIEFPQEYWQTGIQYYWEEQPWGEEFFIRKLSRIITDREERQEFVNEFREMDY